MTTSTLDRIPVNEITERASQVRPGRTALKVFLGVFMLLGWAAGKVFGFAWSVFTLVWASVEEGWTAARGPSRKAQIEALTAQVDELKVQVGRFR